MKKRHYFFIVIFSYLLFLITTIPVNLLTNVINKNTPVHITGASGTILNGKVNTLSIQQLVNLNDTEWTLKFWKLFTGRIAIQLRTHYNNQEITGEIGASILQKFFIYNLSAKVPAEKIAALINIPIAQLSGMVTLDIEQAQWKKNTLPTATGNIIWNDATITVAEIASLGTLSIELNENDQQLLNAVINNKGGDILLSGNAELIPENNYAVNVKLSPTATTSNSLENSLSLFAKKQKNGDYLLKQTGQLNQLGLQ